MLDERFRLVQDRFVHLQGQLAAGRITKAEFTTALQNLMVERDGKFWTIGGNSGKWYLHDGQQWVEADPPSAPEVSTESAAPAAAHVVTSSSSPVQLRELRSLEGHPDHIEALALSPDDRSLLSGGMEGTVMFWRTEGNKPPRSLVEGGTVFKHVFGTSYSTSGTYMVAASKDGFVRVWETHTGRLIRRFTGCKKGAYTAVITPDDNFVLAGCGDGSIQQWELRTAVLVRTFQGHGDQVDALALSLDGGHLGSLSDDQTFRLWNLSNGEELARIALGNDYADMLARGVAFRPRANQVLTYSLGAALDLWNLDTLEQVRRYESGSGALYAAAFSPDGNYLFTATGTDYLEEEDRIAAGGSDNAIHVVDAARGVELGRFEGHKNDVTCLAVSRSGKLLVSGSEDKTIRVWTIE